MTMDSKIPQNDRRLVKVEKIYLDQVKNSGGSNQNQKLSMLVEFSRNE